MKVKNKFFMGVIVLVSMLLFGLAATVNAVTIAAPGVSITIANRATTSQKLGGDITIIGTASDMVAGSTIFLTCPSGLKFDTNNVVLQIGTNISTTSFSVSLYTGTGYTNGYSSDGTMIKLNVDSVPLTGTGTVKFLSNIGTNDDLAVLPSNPSNTSIDSTDLQFSVVTNGDTASPVTNNIGTINILKLPTILSVCLTDSTHFTIQFNCNIDSSTASDHSTALGSGKDLSSVLSTYGLYVANAATAVTSATVALDGSDPTKMDVTIDAGVLNTDGSSTIQTTTNSGQQFVNAKDTQTTPTMTSLHVDAPHTAINIITCTMEDSDGDGISDEEDDCAESNLELTIVIDGCNTGVSNQLFDTGCTMSDLIAECADSARNHGAFVSCVTNLTNNWKKNGLITGKEKGAIQKCAAKSDIK